jgi:hypothetical protein
MMKKHKMQGPGSLQLFSQRVAFGRHLAQGVVPRRAILVQPDLRLAEQRVLPQQLLLITSVGVRVRGECQP